MTAPRPARRQSSRFPRGAKMGAGLVAMGILHFVRPRPFDAIVPTELPGSQRFYTLASGVAETGTGMLLLAPATRRIGALAAIGLYVGVFPANVNMVRLWYRDPTKSRLLRWIAIARLPLQIPMIVQARKVYRES